jgi:KDO2-lipid IV(A) lauroyltransferase
VRSFGIKVLLGLLRLLGRLPSSLLDAIGVGVGELLWRCHSRERGVAEINLALCRPDLSDRERSQLAHAALRDFGRNALQMVQVWFALPSSAFDRPATFDGEDVMRDALAAGRGVLVLAPHIGNWEWLGRYLGRNYQATSMYLPPKKSPELGAAVVAARSRDGAVLVPADAGGVRALLKQLKSGGVVAILPDQEPKQAGAEFAPFFGQPALTMTLVSNLLQRTGARAVFAASIRETESDRYRLVFRAPPPALYADDLPTSLAALNRGVEHLIAEAPAQYQWIYKRFKSQPAGAPDPYAALKQGPTAKADD